MKKIIYSIIVTFLVFSSTNISFANDWYIEKLLDFNSIVQKQELDLSELKYIEFDNEKYNRIYSGIKTVDSILRKWFIKNYNEWKYEYYEINWIIKNYNDFIYHTNQFFYFIKLKQQNKNYVELNSALKKSTIDMISSYNKVKFIIKRK